jgi:hypothetical protein
MAKALDGVSVVEFSSNMGAAYAAMLLAQKGARVIKAEPPGGDASRGTPHFQVLNRSKRSVFFDISTSAGRAAAGSLIQHAEVVVTGMTPARAHQVGLDSSSIAAISPRAIALELPPFGNRGPCAEGGISGGVRSDLGPSMATQWKSGGTNLSCRQLWGRRDGCARPDSMLSAVRGQRRPVPVHRPRQYHLLARVQ